MELLYYVLFPNHDNAMRLYNALSNQNISAKIAPTPRALSKCCGVSLLVNESDIKAIEDCISNQKIEVLGIEHIKKDWNQNRDKFG